MWHKWLTAAMLFTLMVTFGIDAGAAQSFPPSDSNITYIGRWGNATVNATASKVMASGGGNRFQFKFSGTSLSLNFYFTGMTYSPVIEYRIDGGSYVPLTLVSGTNSIATGLSAGTHTVEIWMMGIQENAPRWSNPLAFQGVAVDNGATLSPYPTGAAGKVLVLGDSICEGVLVTGSASYAGQTSYSWGRKSFINQVGTALNLDVWDHAFGGSGFYQAVSGSGVPVAGTNYLYAASGIAKSDPQFDMVVIEVVNNDASMTQAAFVAAYQSLIDAVRADQGNIPIFCIGPFAGFGGTHAADVHTVADAKGCIWVDTSGWSYTHPNLGHPDLAGHTAIAGYLQPIMAPYVPVVPTTATYRATMRATFR